MKYFFKKLKIKFIRYFSHKLSKEDLRGYRNILKLVNHPDMDGILINPDTGKYYVSVESLHLDLIIDENKAEIVNTTQIYPLNLDKKVYERACFRIRKKLTSYVVMVNNRIVERKATILSNLYDQIHIN